MYRILMSESIKSLENAISHLGWEIPEDIRVEEPPNPKLGDVASFSLFSISNGT
jgi:arginyl-tRNA synthetase